MLLGFIYHCVFNNYSNIYAYQEYLCLVTAPVFNYV